MLHQELLDWCGFPRNDTSKHRKVCESHPIETVVKSIKISYNGKDCYKQFQLTVPIGAGPKSNLNPSEKTSLGTGTNQYNHKILEFINSHIHNPFMITPEDDFIGNESKVKTQSPKPKKEIEQLKDEIQKLEQEGDMYQLDAMQATLGVQQILEMNSFCQHIKINQLVLQEANLHVHQHLTNKCPFRSKILPTFLQKKVNVGNLAF